MTDQKLVADIIESAREIHKQLRSLLDTAMSPEDIASDVRELRPEIDKFLSLADTITERHG